MSGRDVDGSSRIDGRNEDRRSFEPRARITSMPVATCRKRKTAAEATVYRVEIRGIEPLTS